MATLDEFFRKYAGQTVAPQPIAETHYCAECHDEHVANRGDICQRCQMEQEQGYVVRTLTGRCANGSERDHGHLSHAILMSDNENKALCGARPGRRSAGWSRWQPDGNNVTCPRCAKKLG